jgi:ribosome modulation factor
MVHHESVPTFYVPIRGLTVVASWDVGPVSVLPTDDARKAITACLSGAPLADLFTKQVEEQQGGAVARVESDDRDNAISMVAAAVDVLRVFQHVRHFQTELPHFGLPGDVGNDVLVYAVLDSERSGHGFSFRGPHLGWTFSDPDEWPRAQVFNRVADAIAAGDPTPGARRALVGVQLLSEALVDQRGPNKMVALVTALEAWLLPRMSAGQTFRLARAVSNFGCGRYSNDLCGRSRDTCPYLALNPESSSDRSRLKTLRERGGFPPWLCSEWHRVVDWYDLRSDVVHGAGPTVSYKDASNALFWVLKYLTEPMLSWLTDHPDDPVGDLDRVIADLPPAPDWEKLLGPL